MNYKIILFAITLTALSYSAFAGPGDNELKLADDLFIKRDFQEAIVNYKKAASLKRDASIQIRIAECYRLMHDYKNAELAYEALAQKDNVDQLTWFYYGNILRNQQKYDEAKEALSKAKKGLKDTKLVDNLVASCDWAKKEIKNPSLYETTLLPIKTGGLSYGVTPYSNGIIMSTQTEQVVEGTKNQKSLEMSYIEIKGARYGKPEPLSKNLPTTIYQGCPSINESGDFLYFTQNASTELVLKTKQLKKERGISAENKMNVLWIYRSKKIGKEWKEAKDLPFPINSNEFNSTTPHITPKGDKIYFASDRPGGFGGMDLYVSSYMGENSWSEPLNLGPEINTAGNELFPFTLGDSVFFFSSDGQIGFGGMDIFESKVKKGKFSKPKNLGFGLNSSKDDFGIVLTDKGKRGYISSDREGEKGGDRIYSLVKGIKYFDVLGLVVDAKNSTQTIPGASIEFLNDSNIVSEVATTDEKGSYKTKLDEEYSYTAIAYAPGYDTLRIKFRAGDLKNVEKIKLNLSTFSANGKLTDAATGDAVKNVKISIYDQDGNLVKEFVSTDGTYNLDDLRKDKKYKIKLEADGYDTATYDVVPGKTDYILKRTPRPGLTYNFKNIYFDLGKFTLKPESFPVLDQIAKYLESEKDRIYKIELSAHTDSRGTSEANKRLSEGRAKAAYQYLIGKGIEAKRLLPVGYGEEQPTNECSDGVTCPEEKHSENRRVEVKILEAKE